MTVWTVRAAWPLVVLGCLAACRAADPAGPDPTGIVFVVGGIGGLDPVQTWAPWALPRAGVRHAVCVFEWTHGKGRLLRDLQDQRHLLAQAGRLADIVREYRALEHGRPVYLVGHSAGAAVVLAAAAQQPPNAVERIVLLSAAVSPTYDLCPALRASRGGIVSFHSTLDRLFLGWGTRRFGTADRVYGPSAGLDGFRQPPDLDEEGLLLYRRLVQVPWRPADLLECRTGLHHSTCMPSFLADKVAPWLLTEPSCP